MKITIQHDHDGLSVRSDSYHAWAEYSGDGRVYKTAIEAAQSGDRAQANRGETGEMHAVLRAYAHETRGWHTDPSGYAWRDVASYLEALANHGRKGDAP